uniref:Uncharacterized protein n=1 Tax=Medicago truncatula TaxID=3880 RepID=Q1RU81_MEDTR|nr:hypothetical protein MtrDRAFT_AC153123g10v2 [Medicago truncatula]
MEEDMEDGESQQRRRGKRPMVPDPEPLVDYPSGPHETTILWRYHVTCSGRRLRESGMEI